MRKKLAGVLSCALMLSAGGQISFNRYHENYVYAENRVSDVIEIAQVSDFGKIQDNVSGHYQLVADIDFSTLEDRDLQSNEQGEVYYPITFAGELDGNGHTVKGVERGLFDSIDAGGKIYDLVIEADFGGSVRMGSEKSEESIESRMQVKYTCAGRNQGSIQNCRVDCRISDIEGVETDCLYVYGLCQENEGIISDSEVHIEATAIRGDMIGMYVAGICDVNDKTIKNCTAGLQIFENEAEQMYVSGICNRNAYIAASEDLSKNRSFGTITDCRTEGQVKSFGQRDIEFGGISIENDGIIEKCENGVNCDIITVCSGGIAAKNSAMLLRSVNHGELTIRGEIEGFDCVMGEIAGKSDGTMKGCDSDGKVVSVLAEEKQQVVLMPTEQVLYGDVNGDDDITMEDAILLRRALAGYSTIEINKDWGDMDQDGEITSADVVILLQYLAGYCV